MMILIAISSAGLLIGRFATSSVLFKAIEEGYLSTAFRLKDSIYFEMNYFLNNEDELKRLTGYYLLHDVKFIDIDFLTKRYYEEKNIVNQRTILWLMSFSHEKAKVLKFYRIIEKSSFKKEIDLYKKRIKRIKLKIK